MAWDSATLRQQFPILQRQVRGKRLVFLDSAASAQKPQAVIDAITHIYTHSYANVHRGIYSLAEEATEAYEAAREKLARFIHAPESAEVIFTRNATEALNLVAYSWGRTNIEPGDRIIITEMEHHANLVPWQQIAQQQRAELLYIPVTVDGELDQAAYAELLTGGAKVVALTLMSNVLGTLPPVREMAAAAHAAGALVVIDAAQAAPHLPVDVQALDADFLALSGHKMGGPAVGALWGRRALLEAMPPFLFGGDMILSVQKYSSVWNDLPYKFEAGTPAIAETVGLGAAVDFLTALGMEAVHQHERELVKYAMAQLPQVPGLRILGPPAERRGGVVAFTLEGIHPHDIASLLDEDAICIRAGLHCAEPLHRRYGLPATARASFYIYNDESDVDALVAGLHKVVKFLRRV